MYFNVFTKLLRSIITHTKNPLSYIIAKHNQSYVSLVAIHNVTPNFPKFK